MSFRDSVIPPFRDSVTAKLKCILLNNFYVCGPTSMKLIPHLLSEVRKMYWQKGGQGPIILGVMSLDWISNFAILESFSNRFLRT